MPADRLRRLLETFGRVETVGESFQVYKSGDIDVSLPRRESKSGRGHRGFDITGDPTMTLDEAARRRDFTINAIAWDPLTDEYLDPCDGRGDIERRLLRVVDPATFGDDSLRVLRAMQFAARFELHARRDDARAVPRHAARRSAGRTHLGRDRKAAVRAAAVDRPGARDGAGRRREAVPGAAGARRLPAGARMASQRATCGSTRCRSSTRRGGASTTSIGRSRSPSCWAPSVTTSASRRRPPSSMAAFDRWITRSRASRRRRRFSIASTFIRSTATTSGSRSSGWSRSI